MTTEGGIAIEKEQKRYIDAIFWGGVLVWAGLVFGADYLGYLPQIGNANAWSWIFLGAGVYGLLISFVRLVSESYANPTTWDWVWAIVFLLIGAAQFLAFNIPWWLFLILFGVVILFGALRQSD